MQCCDSSCLKWRRLPPGESASCDKFDADWFCHMNADEKMAEAGCAAPQEKDEVSTSMYELRQRRSDPSCSFAPRSCNLGVSAGRASGRGVPSEAEGLSGPPFGALELRAQLR